jgi:hypothetical protein
MSFNHFTTQSTPCNNRGGTAKTELPTYKWKEQLDVTHQEEDFAASIANHKKQNGFTKVINLLKEAEGEKMMAKGKRTPFGNVSGNTIRTQNMINLQKKGESRRILNEIQSKLPELC